LVGGLGRFQNTNISYPGSQSVNAAWSKHWHSGRSGPQTAFVWPANAFCMPYFTQSHEYIVLATQPLQVTHHWSASKYATVRG